MRMPLSGQIIDYLEPRFRRSLGGSTTFCDLICLSGNVNADIKSTLGAQYEASLATFWGSWAFLIGSAIQWYESLDKYPVEVEDLGKAPKH